MWRIAVVLLASTLLVPASLCGVGNETSPVILIYSPKAPGYGHALKKVIQEDGRFGGARIRICESLDEFGVTVFFPDVKVVVVSLATDVGQRLNETLEWFFRNGGGLVGMGFAGSWFASFNASEDVFPLFGTSYRTAKYDPKTKMFVMRLVKEDDDEISQGISSFSVPQHKVILHFKASTNRFELRYPDSGKYKVLFSEENTGAPVVIKYEDEGVSVTFASFGGEDVVRSPGYYGLFVDQPEFKRLFTNSLYWVWNNEHKFENSVETASRFYRERSEHVEELRRASAERERRAETGRLIKVALTILVAGGACLAVYWTTFLRLHPSSP